MNSNVPKKTAVASLSVPQRINDFITSHRPNPVCNRCIADQVGLTNDGAHPAQVTGALATTNDSSQEEGTCVICKNQKRVIRRS
jgi:hypothetical protein